MNFSVDKQTLDDLNIFNKKGRDSVFGLFNRTRTRGGGEILEQMFRYPLSDAGAINRRGQIIMFFQTGNMIFPFKEEWFDLVEHYLSNVDGRTKLSHDESKLGRTFSNLMGTDTEYKQIAKGVVAVTDVLTAFRQFLDEISQEKTETPYHEELKNIEHILTDPELQQIISDGATGRQTYDKTAHHDKILRFKKKDLFEKLLFYAYHLDVYMAVAKIATTRQLVFPKALPAGGQAMKVEGVYHPLLESAVGNNLVVTPDSNIVFLTGANMAGKSTFMKSLGIAVFLAHVGFPVPAASMTFPVMDGMFSTINLPDNLGMGYSHFYAEVLRVKKVAEQLALSKKLFVIFDELFRGTNVKDAYEATVALTAAFAGKRDCMFVISTHIIEAGDELKGRCNNIQFTYLPTLMDGPKPVYTYRLEQGITSDRHGMIIIGNEGIIDILQHKGADNQQPAAPSFITDKQTLDDLNLLGKYKNDSVFNLFNHTKTAGGERLLESMFRQPLTDEGQINHRNAVFKYFQDKVPVFPFDHETLVAAENYLSGPADRQLLMAAAQAVRRKGLYYLGLKQEHDLIAYGLNAAINTLMVTSRFVSALLRQDPESPFSEPLRKAELLFTGAKLQWLKIANAGEELSFFQTVHYDYLLRSAFREEMEVIMRLIHTLDVYIAVSGVSKAKGFSYAQALSINQHILDIEDGFHPCLKKAVSNSVKLDQNGNVIFLTGANMAGKSTFMKSFGISIYLAHMGFPVPATSMVFSVKDGIYTSINVPDNLDMGYSHFYAEVLRVKKVAEEVSSPKNLVVIFDELFKGTNVKDAYDATLAVSKVFAEHRNCFFIISTHIVEVGQVLGQHADNIHFTYMPTKMDGKIPVYTYRAKEGISSDRHGMMIIENEDILNIIG